MAREVMPLAVGRGLDRAPGLAAVTPQYPVDARNVYARDAKMAIRPGFTGTGYQALPWGTDVLAIVPVRATGDELFCVYDRTSREIRIYRLDPTTGIMQSVGSPANGLWGTLSALADFPVVLAAEADGNVFFAHDEAAFLFRLPTIYYTPDFVSPSTAGTLTTLTAKLDPTDLAADVTVYFRGVCAYLSYLVGWGFGDASSDEEKDRGDVLRVSVAGEPTVFTLENYALVGARKEAIIAAVPTGNPPTEYVSSSGDGVLALGKLNDAYKLTGSSPIDFDVVLLDPRYGVVSSRCAVNVGGIAYWWSTDGLRRVLASGTEPIAQPLELLSPLPATFPALGPSRLAFTIFDRRRYLLETFFPNTEIVAARTPSFALSLWDPQDPRWTFMIREQCLCCAGEILTSDEGTVPAPTGYASAVNAVDVGVAADARFRSVSVTWQNNDAAGDEIVQIFARIAGGAWAVALSVPVGDTSQTATIATLGALYSCEVALRYVRGSSSAAGYAGDPDAWTAPTAAGAKDTLDTDSAPVAWVSGIFVDAATPVPLIWSSAQLNVPYLIEKDPGTGFVTVIDGVTGSSYPYPIPPAELNTTVTFRITPKRAALLGTVAAPDLDVDMFINIGTPLWISSVWSAPAGQAALVWSAAAQATTYLLEKSTDGGGSWSPVATIGATSYNYVPVSTEINTTVKFRVTGKNGVFSGAASLTRDVTFTVALNAPTAVVANWLGGVTIDVTWTPGVGDNQQQQIWAWQDPVGGAGFYGSLTIFSAVTAHAIFDLSSAPPPGTTVYIEVRAVWVYSGGGAVAASAPRTPVVVG